jgi:hypothetical protein
MRLFALTLLAVLATAAPAAADTFMVDRSDDADVSTCSAANNDCTLRGAIEAVQASGSPGSTITIPATKITLTAPLPAMTTGSFTIAGAGARQTTISGGGTVAEIFNGAGALVTLQDVTVTGGIGAGFGAGAVSGSINLERVAIVDNQETGLASANALVDDSTIARNHGVINGGAVAQGDVIRNSTIADNTAAPDPSVAPFVTSGGLLAAQFDIIEHSTIADNTVVPGASLASGANIGVLATTTFGIVLQSSIVDAAAATTARPNCGSAVQSQGNNISSDLSCALGRAGDHEGVDPQLGPLTDNGGPTDTMALLAGSPAIDAGAGCTASDQRGVTRAQGTACDAGAFESAFTAPVVVPASPPPGPPSAPPVTIIAPPPPPPADRTAPKLTIEPLAKTITAGTLNKGLKVTITANEPIVAELTLLVTRGRSHTPDLELASRSLPARGGRQTVTLRPTRRLTGSARVTAQVRVVAYDLAGNRSTRTTSVTVGATHRR